MPEIKRFDCITCESWLGEPRARKGNGVEERYCLRFNMYTAIVDYCNDGPSGEPSLSDERSDAYRKQSMDGKRPIRPLPFKRTSIRITYQEQIRPVRETYQRQRITDKRPVKPNETRCAGCGASYTKNHRCAYCGSPSGLGTN